MTTPLHALTLIRPWGWAIVHGGKDVENRTWAPPAKFIGEMIAIHHGKKFDEKAAEEIVEFLEMDELPPEAVDEGIIGLARIARVVSGRFDPEAVDPAQGSPWFSGPVGWVLADRVWLPKPLPCRGAQGLWPVPTNIANAALCQYDAQVEARI